MKKIYTQDEKIQLKVSNFLYLGKEYSAVKFHDHMKDCEICKNNPFDLCKIGKEIMESLVIRK